MENIIHKYKNFKAFTLIELMIVISIIGILAAIVFAPLQTALRKGRDAKKISEMKTLQTALMLYADSHNGAYPECLENLITIDNDILPKNSNIGACAKGFDRQESPKSAMKRIGEALIKKDLTIKGESSGDGTTFSPNMYNYTSYADKASMTYGYHLYVHLETASQALSGAAKCQGSSSEYNTKSCFIGREVSTGGVKEPSQGTATGEADFLEHKNDNDIECNLNTALCIYDIKG